MTSLPPYVFYVYFIGDAGGVLEGEQGIRTILLAGAPDVGAEALQLGLDTLVATVDVVNA